MQAFVKNGLTKHFILKLYFHTLQAKNYYISNCIIQLLKIARILSLSYYLKC